MYKYIVSVPPRVQKRLDALKADNQQIILAAIDKAFEQLRKDPRHPSLNSKHFREDVGQKDKKLFRSYAQNNTPRAYRILWYYGPEKAQLTIFAIIPHE